MSGDTMKKNRIKTLIMALALCAGLLLTSCSDANKGGKIEDMLEDTYGGNFKLISSTPCNDFPFPYLNYIAPTYYQYRYEWNKVKGNVHSIVAVTTKGDGYQTNANHVRYHEDLDDYFRNVLEENFPGRVVASFFMLEYGSFETEIVDMDFDDVLYSDDWDYSIQFIVAVDDVNDHKAVEKAVEKTFEDYRMRVEAHVISVDDVDDVISSVDFSEEDEMQLYFDHEQQLPKHEYYLYHSRKDMKGATGWYEMNGRG